MAGDVYSKRGKPLPDVYHYETIPSGFRIQVEHVWDTAIGKQYFYGVARYKNGPRQSGWETIERTVAKEHCVRALGDLSEARLNCKYYLHNQESAEKVLDLVEAACRFIDREIRSDREARREQRPDSAINEINHRFREHGLGYEYQSGKIIRIDSQFLHQDVVRPALHLLQEAAFKGAEEEFLSAHDHYRAGRTKEAMNDALKAFESTMKCIANARQWQYDPRSTAKGLIDVLFNHQLVAPFMEAHFSALRTTLEAGIPTLRNKQSGHGQGSTPIDVPTHMAAYAIHLTATNIVFLVEAHKSRS